MSLTKEHPFFSHLLSIQTLNKHTINYILDRADYFFNEIFIKKNTHDNLKDKVIVNLFFEPSTRTLHSFEIAAKKLKGIVINPKLNNLATLKGESLLDTIKTFEAMGTDLFIIRHFDNNTPEFIASELHSTTCLINGGDGDNQHPIQCLTDLAVIKKNKPNFHDLKVVIVGDIAHSRVARSMIEGLKIMGTTNIHLVGPKSFLPNNELLTDCTMTSKLQESIKDADVVMPLRIQKERMDDIHYPNPQKYFQEYGITPSAIFAAKPDVLVMHPGPLNRGIEIDSSVADSPLSVILKQVQNGVTIRMAVMDMLLNKN